MRDRKSDSAHRQVAERKIGRRLLPSEVVDHVNEEKTDNSPANVRPMDRSAHTTHHNRTRQLSKLRKALRKPGASKLY